MGTLWQDMRYAARLLMKSPGFTFAAVLSLALGIGANTAIFSVVNAVLFRSLPYNEPDSLVILASTYPPLQSTQGPISLPDYMDWRRETETFAHVAIFQPGDFDLTGEVEPRRLSGAAVSEDFFSVLTTPPVLGRAFLPEDHQPTAPRVTVLSYGFWKSYFGASKEVVGKKVTLNGLEREVIGVMPPEAQLPKEAEVWVPLRFGATPPQWMNRYDDHEWEAVARLNPGVSLAQANAVVETQARRVEQQFPNLRKDWGATVVPIHRFIVGSTMRLTLWVLFGSVLFVLLIASANVANLMLTRATGRQKELAIRAALGAGRLRLARQLLTEGVMLAVVGGTCGLGLAYLGTKALVSLSPEDIPRIEETNLDLRVFAFALGLSLLTGLLFGLVPALRASKLNLNESLKEGWRATGAGSTRNRYRNLLVVSEIALSLVLLVGAGLMIKSFLRVQQVDPGVRVSNLLTFQLALPYSRYKEPAQQTAFFERLTERLEALPSVEAVGAVSALPIRGGGFYLGRTLIREGQPEPPAGPEYSTFWNWAAPGYFNAVGIPLVKGRYFTKDDKEQSTPVIIISESLAREMFPNEDPLGKRVKSWRDEKIVREVVGVVGDVRAMGMDDDLKPVIYVPQLQSIFLNPIYVVRTTGDPLRMVSAIRDELWSLDKDLPMAKVATMEQTVQRSIAGRRFNMLLISIFAGLALMLATVGIYGVISYWISQRTHEIGIRMALGARRRDIFGMVIGQGMTLTAIGLALGLAGSFALTRFLSSLLFGVSATDAITFVSITGLLCAVALAACYIPARRATRVDPMVALRYE